MNHMEFDPGLIQERHRQMLGELDSLRLEKRLRATVHRGARASLPSLAGAHCRCWRSETEAGLPK